MSISSAKGVESGRSAPKVHGMALLALTFQGIGIIYADLGTSPLYTLNGIWPASGPVPSEEDVIGGISAIVWAITILPLIKYVLVCLEFGTHEGEGGPFALFQGLYPPEVTEGEIGPRLYRETAFEEKSKSRPSPRFRWPLLIWTLLGTSLTLADGVLTPAVSITSAVSGIAVAEPSVADNLVPISIGFLLVLFFAQPLGTSRLASIFSPMMILWFGLIAVIGIYNIISFPGILRAFDPSRAVMLFVRTGHYDYLAGVVLALTGCEAMFANLGQFNALSIRISFTTVVYPSICLAYLGQGARLITDKEAVLENIFYRTIPGSSNGALFWLTYVVAIFATAIASQTLITATFSLVQQLVNMKSLPPMDIKYTSNSIQGQIYVPMANWILMIATILCVVGFRSNAALTNAFGFAVATVMFTTTILIALQMHYVKGLHILFGVMFFIIFGFFDGLFWGATLKKVPEGAWVPLAAGIILMLLMALWTWAKNLEDKFDDANRRDLWSFITSASDVSKGEAASVLQDKLSFADDEVPHKKVMDNEATGMEACYYVATDIDGGAEPKEKVQILTRIDTCAVFHKLSAGRGVPHSFVGFIKQWPALPRVIIFLSVDTVSVPQVDPEDRYFIHKIHPSQCFYSVVYRRGFREEYSARFDEIIERVCRLEITLEARTNVQQAERLVDAIRRCTSKCTHIAPYYHLISQRRENPTRVGKVLDWMRAILLERAYRRLVALSNEVNDKRSAPNQLIHVGVNAVI